MKQILQNLGTGLTEVADVPVPRAGDGRLLIRTTRSLVSAGTERMLVEFGKAGLLSKARQQPDKVRMVLDKIRTDGLKATIESVRNKLDQPLAMGYCNVGVVAEIGRGVTGFAVGDRVASNGSHAEFVSVPTNLCALVPSSVSDDDAAFMVVAAIGLQGIRLAQPTLGECVVVTGLGLIGLLTVQLLHAHGCRVLGLDFNARNLELARNLGADVVDLSREGDPIAAADVFSRGRGVDAVIVTAATESSEPIHQAAVMCRKRGRIVLVGVTGLELSRDDFYRKELSFQVSCSYGPGRYDPAYEERGEDYPAGFVRWTEQRNFEAVLDMMARRRVDPSPLVSHRFPVGRAEEAYGLLTAGEPSLGILLEYPASSEAMSRSVRFEGETSASTATSGAPPGVSFIGAGNYARAMLIPAFKEAGARLVSVASAGGASGLHAARKFGFRETTTDAAEAVRNPEADAVVIATRHDSHARLVLDALSAGKHVFVEKPLCLTLEELDSIERTYASLSGTKKRLLMVGFNRRFAPHVIRIKELLAGVSGPRAFVATVNAGSIPSDHWTQDASTGGGRIVGEACHFIDLLRFLAGSPITSWSRATMAGQTSDTTTLQLGFGDGSVGTIHYFSNGSRAFPKERIEVFAQGRVLQLDNYRRLTGFGWPGLGSMRLWRQDKGHRGCAAAFLKAVRTGGRAPIPFPEIVEVSRVTIDLASA